MNKLFHTAGCLAREYMKAIAGFAGTVLGGFAAMGATRLGMQGVTAVTAGLAIQAVVTALIVGFAPKNEECA